MRGASAPEELRVAADQRVNPIIRFVGFIRKRIVLKRFLTVLPRRLVQDYGHRGPYTPAQIESTISRHKLSPQRYWPYALALFSDRQGLERLRGEPDRSHDYLGLRAELGGMFFEGDPDFTIGDVYRYSAEHSSHGESGGHSGDGGSHHAGGDAGGGHH